MKKYFFEDDNMDLADIYDDIEIEFHTDGDFEMSFNSNSGYTSYYGNWTFNSDKTEINLDLDDGQQAEWEIKRLSCKELWFEAPGLEGECQKK